MGVELYFLGAGKPVSGNKPAVISYTDTLFRKDFVNNLTSNDSNDSDVTIVIDSYWRERYSNRSREDIVTAETLTLEGKEVEFTGLVYLSSKAVSLLRNAIEEGSAQSIGEQLLDIIDFYENNNFTIAYKDIEGDWAEFNSPTDIANFILGTKADTLARLEPIVKNSHIGKQECFTTK